MIIMILLKLQGLPFKPKQPYMFELIVFTNCNNKTSHWNLIWTNSIPFGELFSYVLEIIGNPSLNFYFSFSLKEEKSNFTL